MSSFCVIGTTEIAKGDSYGTRFVGDAYIDEISREIQETFPGIKGFNRRGLYRMKKFYETYKDNEIVTPLVTQISWTNHLLIMSGCKTDEEMEFYIRLCIKENYSNQDHGQGYSKDSTSCKRIS